MRSSLGMNNKIQSKTVRYDKCQRCKKWIEVRKGSYTDNGAAYFSPLMQALDKSGRWVCHDCWDAIDIEVYGPYLST